MPSVNPLPAPGQANVHATRALAREDLRRRIDDEMGRLGEIDLSSWMTALPVAVTPAARGMDWRASEVDLDVTLAGLLLQARERLSSSHSLHVTRSDGTLVAVFQPATGAIYARHEVGQTDLVTLTWQRRPASAGTAPANWRETSFAAVLWRFALFGPAGEQALPRHYRRARLRLRQLPPLARALVAGRHFKLMQLLHARDRSFTELQELTGLSEAQLCRDLAALMLVGSLTTADST